MKFIPIFVLFLIGLFQFSCNKTCENIKVGEVALSAQAQNYLVYSSDQQVEFKNQDGIVRTFTATITENVYFLCQKITCKPLDPYKSNFCEYIEAPITEMFLSSDSTLLGITATVSAYETESDLFFDPIKFTLSHVNASIDASHITAARFTDPPFKKADILDIENFVGFKNVIEIGTETFYDVFFYEDGDYAFYFKEYDGFIAFKTPNNTWTIKQ